MPALKTLAIIAGGGDLPKILAQFCKQQEKPYWIIALEGQADPEWIADHPHTWVALGQIKSILQILEKHQISSLVFAGAVSRPSFKSLKMDATALEWLAKIGLKAFGDDGLFKGIIQQLEKKGFEVLGVQAVLESLLMPAGVLGKIQLSEEDVLDVRRGFEVAKILGQADIGQAVIIEQGVVLAVEAAEGTAELLKRTKDLKKCPTSMGVLVKASKPHQELRMDLPTVGPDTLILAAEIGLKGIALERGKGLLLHQERCIQLADELGLFLVGSE